MQIGDEMNDLRRTLLLCTVCTTALIACAGQAPPIPSRAAIPGVMPGHGHEGEMPAMLKGSTVPAPLSPDYDLADYLWEASDYYFHTGDHERCIRLNLYIVDLDPSFIEAYLGAAWLQDSADRFDEAKATLELGIRHNPEHYACYFDLGWYHTKQHEYEKALRWYKLAAERECPPNVPRMVANTLEKLGRLPEALAHWRELLKLYPDDQVVIHNIGRLEQKLKVQSATGKSL